MTKNKVQVQTPFLMTNLYLGGLRPKGKLKKSIMRIKNVLIPFLTCKSRTRSNV